MTTDNPSDQELTSNPVAHIHHYVLKGSGLSCWAECEDVTWFRRSDDQPAGPCWTP